ncbi:ER membrane protein complex subunit 7-like isoform X2 [Varroa destructor]|uniref:ER membrane protein complex subunit 7 beta-sandwich domain-containing protein n=1 Tax=Varroa destructor TaxID=109461 RepID=A0A7M7KF33_VARDE|nr:ER membrane protein complex subunit 7-like isoform X2 [Varroa destructor]
MRQFSGLGTFLFFCSSLLVTWADDVVLGDADYTIEGKLIIPANQENFTDIIEETQILIDGGSHIGFLKEDYTFEIKNVAAGSYLIQIAHPLISFESVRVDISSKGSKRARRVNNLQPNLNHQLQYPVKIRPTGTHNYFHQLMSAEDMAQTQREVQQMQNAARMPDMPELSELATKYLGGQQSRSSQQSRGQGSGQGSSAGSGKKKN